jgi:hypothetical protein
MMDYYDLVLGLIPLSIAGISGALLVLGVGLPAAVSAGAVVAAGVVGHAMFVRGPVGRTAESGAGTDTDTYNTAD